MNLRTIGKFAEQIVANYYIHSNYTILQRNFTIRGGEIDIIAENDDELVFIEVKAIHHTDDLDNYITQKKLSTLQKTIDYYLRKHPTTKAIRLDIAFVKGKSIFSIHKNVTNL